jgi:uncharacterized membrane protein (TIGR01666 family)
VVLLTGLISGLPIALGVLIFSCCFVLSMLGVYGNRESSVGIAGLLVMVLSIDHPGQGWENFRNALLVLGGGIWYTLLSLLLYSFRPYRLAQQALGECIQSTAAYLSTKASFYDPQPDYEKNYERLLVQQVDLHQKQDLIRELLFRSRNLVKDSTTNSRIQVMIFLDMIDLFEMLMTSHQDYPTLHRDFDKYDILSRLRDLILMLAGDLYEMGLAIQKGRPSAENSKLQSNILDLDQYFNQFRDEHRNASNVEGFIGLRQILNSIHDVADRMHSLHGYTVADSKPRDDFNNTIELEQFISRQEGGLQLLLENCNLRSSIYRHAIRVSVATTVGYIISKFLPVGHGYWILLTIIVILKPAYSLTKKRNYERLLGTIGGALIGIAILFFFKNNSVLLGFMIVFMIGAYSFLRTRYLIGVLFMTPYVLLLFHLIAPQGFRNIVTDRLIDTGIGSAIAFLANFFIMPVWEKEQMLDFMLNIIQDNKSYFSVIAGSFTENPANLTDYKLSRKNALVSLANLSDAFNRMLTEPKSKQKNIRELHQFVVLNHMLTSYIATLSYYGKKVDVKYSAPDYLTVIQWVEQKLDNCVAILRQQAVANKTEVNNDGLRNLLDRVNVLVEQRKSELRENITESETRNKLSEWKPIADQFNFIARVTEDLKKLCSLLAPQSLKSS